jgi:predicted amidohydrolase
MSTATLKVAITQAEPVYLDLAGTLEKTLKLVDEAAQNGARIIAFPEVWMSGYPGWIWYVYPICIDNSPRKSWPFRHVEEEADQINAGNAQSTPS